MGQNDEAARLLRVGYGLTGRLSLLSAGNGKAVHRVHRRSAPDLVLRVYDASDTSAALSLASVLAALDAVDYPAEVVRPAEDGALLSVHGAARGLLTTFLGEPVEPWCPATGRDAVRTSARDAPNVFLGLGDALGRLHARTAGVEMAPARMLPGPELAYARGRLATIPEPIPDRWRELYERLVTDIESHDRGEGLPCALIHNDCHPGNAVRTPSGGFALVDWEVAGRGPMTVDLGALLAECCRESGQLDRECIAATVAGYEKHRTVTDQEWRRLRDGVRFPTLTLLAATLPERLSAGFREDEPIYGRPYGEWLARYEAADAVTELARAAASKRA